MGREGTGEEWRGEEKKRKITDRNTFLLFILFLWEILATTTNYPPPNDLNQ